MTTYSDGYCLNTEKENETKGVCFDNLTFSTRPEVSSLFPWVLEGGDRDRAGGARWPVCRDKGVQAFPVPGWLFFQCRMSLGLLVWFGFALFTVTKDEEPPDLGSSWPMASDNTSICSCHLL